MNEEQVKGSWNDVAGAVREKYGQITSDDIALANGSLQQLIGTIQKKTGDARETIEKFLESAGGSASTYVNRVREHAGDYAANAGTIAKDQYARASEAVSDGVESAKEVVTQRPMEAVLTAFGIGIAAGAIFALSLSSRRR